jgi:hypothetical protein
MSKLKSKVHYLFVLLLVLAIVLFWVFFDHSILEQFAIDDAYKQKLSQDLSGYGTNPSPESQEFTYYDKPLAPLSVRANDGLEGIYDGVGISAYCPAFAKNQNLYLNTQLYGRCVPKSDYNSTELIQLESNSNWATLSFDCPANI